MEQIRPMSFSIMLRQMRISTCAAGLLVMLLHQISACLGGGLEVGFYQASCGVAEFIVKDEVVKGVRKNASLAAGLIRMHFHDCFVRGCDASVLLDSTPAFKAEKDAPANSNSLRGFEVIRNAKATLEATCPGVVSCADILALAARDSVELVGGTGYDVPTGRRDGMISLASDTIPNIPPPSSDLQQLTQFFTRKGLTREEMVILSGAHTVGVAHCRTIAGMISNYSSESEQHPSWDPSYADELQRTCSRRKEDSSLVVPMDSSTPFLMDTSYYANILWRRALFTSDLALLDDPETAKEVALYTTNPFLWNAKFAAAMVKMGGLDVLTGAAGEIRTDCSVVNNI